MVSLDFGLSDEASGPVLDESLPRSINKTVRLLLSQHLIVADNKAFQMSFLC